MSLVLIKFTFNGMHSLHFLADRKQMVKVI
jgi:hypothetical protein